MPDTQSKRPDVEHRLCEPWTQYNPSPRPVVQVWAKIPLTKVWLLMQVLPIEEQMLAPRSA